MNNPDRTPPDPIDSELVREDAAYVDIVMQFVEGLGARVRTMEDALNKGDFEQLCMAAHQLKGSGGGYGYPILTEQAAALERLAKQESVSECTELISDLRSLCERIVVQSD